MGGFVRQAGGRAGGRRRASGQVRFWISVLMSFVVWWCVGDIQLVLFCFIYYTRRKKI